MNRRSLLKGLSGAIGIASAAIVAVPGVAWVIEALRRRPAAAGLVRRLVRLNDLPTGRPLQFPVLGERRDAWTVHPQEAIGRVWLVREGDSPDDPSVARIAAYSAVCPHLGCAIQLDAQGEHFICPCHKAAFGRAGQPLGERELGHRNHAPRGMDSLECRVVQDEQTQEWWVEVKYEKFEQGLSKKVAQA